MHLTPSERAATLHPGHQVQISQCKILAEEATCYLRRPEPATTVQSSLGCLGNLSYAPLLLTHPRSSFTRGQSSSTSSYIY